MLSESEAINELATALAKAQAEMGLAKKDKTNPHYKSAYADLASIHPIAQVLAKHGLAIVCAPRFVDNAYVMVGKLIHTSGQWTSGFYPLPLSAKPHEMGSAMTYARRYLTCALANIAADEDDDDGNAAQDTSATVDRMVTLAEIQQLEALISQAKDPDLTRQSCIGLANKWQSANMESFSTLRVSAWTTLMEKLQHAREDKNGR